MPKRGKGGRFVKSGHKSHKGKSRRETTALVVAAPRAITRTRTQYVTAPRRHRRGGSFGGGGTPAKIKAEIAGWAAALGYFSVENASTYAQIPTFGKLPREAVLGIALHLVGRKHKHVDRASTAALTIAGFKLGEQKFALKGDDDEDY